MTAGSARPTFSAIWSFHYKLGEPQKSHRPRYVSESLSLKNLILSKPTAWKNLRHPPAESKGNGDGRVAGPMRQLRKDSPFGLS